MPIKFVAAAGQFFICDFGSNQQELGLDFSTSPCCASSKPTNIAPEMTKERPVIALNRQAQPTTYDRPRTCLVVPLSTREPGPLRPVHFRLTSEHYPFLSKEGPSWVKADMISAVSYTRLKPIWTENSEIAVLNKEHLIAVQTCVAHALGLTVNSRDEIVLDEQNNLT